MTKSFAYLLLAAGLLTGSASAKDYGVHGNVWPITEVDVRQLLLQSASEVDWSKVQDEVKDSATKYLDNLPKRHLPVAERTETAWVDPSIVLTSDIQAPVKQFDGSIAWQVMHPKGTKVNPLEKFRPVTAMLFFDGSQPDQLELVKKVLAEEPNRIVPVEAGAGNVKNNNEFLSRPTFHATDAMLNRFQIKHLPALLFPGSGEYSLYLGVASFAKPFSPAEVLASWADLNKPLPATPSRTAK